MVNFYNSDRYNNDQYRGEDIHIFRNGDFSLSSYFATDIYDLEYAPQLWGSQVTCYKDANPPGAQNIIPFHQTENDSATITSKINPTCTPTSFSDEYIVQVDNVKIHTYSGIVNAMPHTGTGPILYNFLIEVRAYNKNAPYNLVERIYIRVHVHNNIKSINLSPQKIFAPQGFNSCKFSIHATFDDDVIGDIIHMSDTYIDWSVDNPALNAIKPDTTGNINVPGSFSTGTYTITAKLKSIVPLAPPPSSDTATANLIVMESWETPTISPKVKSFGPSIKSTDKTTNFIVLPDGFPNAQIGNFEVAVKDYVNYIQNSSGIEVYPWGYLAGNTKFFVLENAENIDCDLPGTILQECVPVNSSNSNYDSMILQDYISRCDEFYTKSANAGDSPSGWNDLNQVGATMRTSGLTAPDITVGPWNYTNGGWLLSLLTSVVGLPVKADAILSEANKQDDWRKLYLSTITVENAGPAAPSYFVYGDIFRAWRLMANKFLPRIGSSLFAISVGSRPKAIQSVFNPLFKGLTGNSSGDSDSLVIAFDKYRMDAGKLAYYISNLKYKTIDEANVETMHSIGSDFYSMIGGNMVITKSADVSNKVLILCNMPFASIVNQGRAGLYDNIPNSVPSLGGISAGVALVNIYNGEFIIKKKSDPANTFELFHFVKDGNEYLLSITNTQMYSSFAASSTGRRGFRVILNHELNHVCGLLDEYGSEDADTIFPGQYNALLHDPVNNAGNVQSSAALNYPNLMLAPTINGKRIKWRFLRFEKVGVITNITDSGTDYVVTLREWVDFLPTEEHIYLRTAHVNKYSENKLYPNTGWAAVEINQGNSFFFDSNAETYTDNYIPLNDPCASDFSKRNFSPQFKIQSLDKLNNRITITKIGTESFQISDFLQTSPPVSNSLIVMLKHFTAGSYYEMVASEIVTEIDTMHKPLADTGVLGSGPEPNKNIQNPTFVNIVNGSIKKPTKRYKIVGLYAAGAAFYNKGIFHPTGMCLMRNQNYDVSDRSSAAKTIVNYGCCPICSYLLIDKYYPEKHLDIDANYDLDYFSL